MEDSLEDPLRCGHFPRLPVLLVFLLPVYGQEARIATRFVCVPRGVWTHTCTMCTLNHMLGVWPGCLIDLKLEARSPGPGPVFSSLHSLADCPPRAKLGVNPAVSGPCAHGTGRPGLGGAAPFPSLPTGNSCRGC